MTIGVGAGQMSRVYSRKLPASKPVMKGWKWRDTPWHPMLFPFRDGIDVQLPLVIPA